MNPGALPSDLRIPRDYNASELIDRNVAEGRGAKPAVRYAGTATTYAELSQRMNRAGNALRELGVEMEQRVLLCLLDSVDFPTFFWGAIKIGAVPVPVNTMLSSRDYDFLLRDSRARVLVVSGSLLEKFQPILQAQPFLKAVVVSERGPEEAPTVNHTPVESLLVQVESLLASASPQLEALRPPATMSPSGSTPVGPPVLPRAPFICTAI